MRWCGVLIGWAFLVFGGTPALAQIDFKERRTYYTLPPLLDSKREIWDAIERYGPHGRQGSAIGTAASDASMRFTSIRSGNLCTLDTLELKMHVTLRLPRWPSAYANDDPQRQFFRCVKATVTVHEKRHAEIHLDTVKRAQRVMRDGLRDVPCGDFVKRARGLFNREMHRGAQRQRAFDKADYARPRYQKCMRLKPGEEYKVARHVNDRVTYRSSRRYDDEVRQPGSVSRQSAPEQVLGIEKHTRSVPIENGLRRQADASSDDDTAWLDWLIGLGALTALGLAGLWFLLARVSAEVQSDGDWAQSIAFENTSNTQPAGPKSVRSTRARAGPRSATSPQVTPSFGKRTR
ncbi:MAG: DUF922 domain-containing protein [Pseudomonadota bacterium]